MEQFLLLGDSITQQAFSQDRGTAFGAALSDAYIRRLDIINRGLSGYNTRQALQVLPQIIPPPSHARIRLMTIFFGANDARLPNTPGGPQQHIPIEEFRQNLRAIVNHPLVRAHPDIGLILITPPPVDERKSLSCDKVKDPKCGDVHRRRAPVTAAYAQAVRDLGRETDLPVIDLWTAMIAKAGGTAPGDDDLIVGDAAAPVSVDLQNLLEDGLHLSAAGYRVLYSELMALIEKRWPELTPAGMQFALPTWSDETAWT
jgi:lysophospholipase L1-like esterase